MISDIGRLCSLWDKLFPFLFTSSFAYLFFQFIVKVYQQSDLLNNKCCANIANVMGAARFTGKLRFNYTN